MALVSDKLVVPHVTAHMSLRRALDSLSVERILNVILLARGIARRLGRGERVAVMGVNPHAGENGAFGDEELRIIGPAVERARSGGTEVVGPLPPDTVFMRALRGEFDVVVCMYHDQGHIPMKTIGFDDTVNVTVGLPIVRTSVDHGTAFDIAYQGVVSIGSFVHACELAERLAGGAAA
jgi:4-hydroxythreonine-4-phosphate dehydrogenase